MTFSRKTVKSKNAGREPSPQEINMLVALFKQGRYAEIENLARAMTMRFPLHAFSWKAMGTALLQQGRAAEALLPFQKATELVQGDAQLHNNLGNALAKLGRMHEAEASYRQVLTLNPGFVEAHHNLGNTLMELGRLFEAEASFRRALELKPDFAEAYNNLGNAQRDIGQINDAFASYRHALMINPNYVEVYNNQGNTLYNLGRLEDAAEIYRRALAIKPDYAEAHSNMLFCLSHSESLEARALFAEHVRFGEQFEVPLRANWPQHTNSRNPERCLQIGFVSGDFRKHAVAHFFEPVLAHLSGYSQLSLHAYANHAIDDSTTQRLRGYFAHWHPVFGLSDAALAGKIREDGIDILYDLSGHTGKNRLLTFARKPAPVQASWIGYPGTTGLSAIDYYQSDRFLFPDGRFDEQFIEKIVRLPASSAFLPSKDAPPINILPALNNGYMTFGSFNRPSKINSSTIALWAQLLRALPNSRMLLGAMPQDGNFDLLIDLFAREGIARERLIFHPRCDMAAYLGLHQQVDICLDTFPYNGGTTTLHALWMGVPTLTLAGHTLAGWAGASFLGHMGLEAFAAHDAADFVQKGLYWAGNLAALSDIRAGLRERFANSARGQPAVVAASMERALRIMWQRWCVGLPAESFEVLRQDIDSTMQASGN